jgi:hypothetical protein
VRSVDKICLRLQSLFRRGQVDRELDDEIRFHLDHLVEENITTGIKPTRRGVALWSPWEASHIFRRNAAICAV